MDGDEARRCDERHDRAWWKGGGGASAVDVGRGAVIVRVPALPARRRGVGIPSRRESGSTA